MLSLSVLRNACIYSLYKRLGVLLCPSRAVYTLLSNTIDINSQRPRERTQIQTLQSDLSIIIRNRRQSNDFPAFEHWVFQVYGYCSNQYVHCISSMVKSESTLCSQGLKISQLYSFPTLILSADIVSPALSLPETEGMGELARGVV